VLSLKTTDQILT